MFNIVHSGKKLKFKVDGSGGTPVISSARNIPMVTRMWKTEHFHMLLGVIINWILDTSRRKYASFPSAKGTCFWYNNSPSRNVPTGVHGHTKRFSVARKLHVQHTELIK